MDPAGTGADMPCVAALGGAVQAAGTDGVPVAAVAQVVAAQADAGQADAVRVDTVRGDMVRGDMAIIEGSHPGVFQHLNGGG